MLLPIVIINLQLVIRIKFVTIGYKKLNDLPKQSIVYRILFCIVSLVDLETSVRDISSPKKCKHVLKYTPSLFTSHMLVALLSAYQRTCMNAMVPIKPHLQQRILKAFDFIFYIFTLIMKHHAKKIIRRHNIFAQWNEASRLVNKYTNFFYSAHTNKFIGEVLHLA